MTRFKRSDCLAFWFRDGRLRCQNYLTGVEVAADARLFAVLDALDRWRTFAAIARSLPDHSPRSIHATLRALLRHTLIVAQGSDQARQERALAPWRVWGDEAAIFHFATKHAHQGAAPVRDDRAFTRALLRQGRPPAAVKRYPAHARLRLPDVGGRLAGEWPRVLLARRTTRRFGRQAVSLDELATLLFLSWGVTGSIRWPGLGRVPVKTSPSGGARQPLEVYVYVRRIAGLRPGIYHYRGDRHVLTRLRRGCRAADLAARCAKQRWIGRCAALCVMTATFPRVMWRYKFSRAYRVVLLEAGHAGQTFCLAATWLGLGAFCTAALVDEDIERDLGVDGVNESVVYAVGVGTSVGRPGL